MSKKGFTDIHSHFIYGMDDGARTAQDMYAMLDAAYRDGITTLYATPHATLGIEPFDIGLFIEHLEEARAYCDYKQYGIDIQPGAELLYTPAMHHHIADQQLPTLGDSNMALIEFTPCISYRELADTVTMIEQADYTPVLAHVERYQCLFHSDNLRRLCDKHDVRCQINANTLLSKQGFLRDRVIGKWLKNRLIDFVASDAHNTTSRPFRMQDACQALQSKRLGEEGNELLYGLP